MAVNSEIFSSEKKAFTLLELIIVTIILGILASIGIIQYGAVIEKGRSSEAYTMLAEIVNAERAYYAENDSYTSTFTDLDRFSEDPTSDNFTYTIASTDVEDGYAQAARINANAGRKSYSMCLKNNNKAWCDADTCVPNCN